MDRYLIKIPRPPKSSNKDKSLAKPLKQTTIESLQGVVVVENILRLKSVLKLENQSVENLQAALSELGLKTPSRDVLKSTKIGHTINKLTNHENDEVAKQAKKILKQWKTHFEAKLDKPMMEVRCDLKTEKLRKAGRKLLAGALQVTEKHRLPEVIEREAFSQHGRLVNVSYRRTVRTLVFTLKHQEEVRNKVLSQSMEVKDLVVQYKKEAKKS